MADIRAGSSSKFTFTIVDAGGVPVPAAAVATLTLSLINVDTDAVIGAWNNRDVKNANGGTLVDGGGTITIPAADNALISTSLPQERHQAVLKFTTASEAGSGELMFMVTRVHA